MVCISVLEVSLVNGEGGSTVNAQGWSYAVAMTFDDIVAVEAAPGADAAALMGGEGPDFVHYNLEDSSEDGAVRGVTAGAVISRPEERHILLCLVLLCSVFSMPCRPSKTKLRCHRCYRGASFTKLHGARITVHT